MARGEAHGETPACTGSQPSVTAADFSALYQRCMASGLKACVTISYVVGCQIFTVTCTLPVPAVIDTTAGRCRRRWRRCGRAATAADVKPAQFSPPVAPTQGNSSQPAPSPPPPDRYLFPHRRFNHRRRKEPENDVTRLNCSQTSRRRANSSFHLCPLQLRHHRLHHLQPS